MRALLLLLSAVFMCSACAKDVQLVESTGSADPIVRSEKAVVEIRLSDAELGTFSDVETGVWDKARAMGLQSVFNRMLVKDTVFVPVDGMTAMDALDGAYVQTGTVTQSRDAETGDLVQSFGISARFVGDLSVGGEIVTVEESNYLAGGTDTVYAMLYNNTPASLPAYVVIAEPVQELGSGFCRLIGMGEIIQTMDNMVSLPADKGGAMGKLCSVEVVVGNREVEPGDKVFLMSVNMAALDPELSLPAEAEPETVVVEPPHRDVVHAPKEQK
jgi:hypothetical protein